jgi:hypothetical protein
LTARLPLHPDDATQAPSDPAIQRWQLAPLTEAEIPGPTPHERVQVGDHLLQAVALRQSGRSICRPDPKIMEWRVTARQSPPASARRTTDCSNRLVPQLEQYGRHSPLRLRLRSQAKGRTFRQRYALFFWEPYQKREEAFSDGPPRGTEGSNASLSSGESENPGPHIGFHLGYPWRRHRRFAPVGLAFLYEGCNITHVELTKWHRLPLCFSCSGPVVASLGNRPMIVRKLLPQATGGYSGPTGGKGVVQEFRDQPHAPSTTQRRMVLRS